MVIVSLGVSASVVRGGSLSGDSLVLVIDGGGLSDSIG